MKRRGIWIAAILLALSAGWYFGSPWWTLWRMASLSEAHDTRGLSSYIDYRALRGDMRAQVNDRMRGKGLISKVRGVAEKGVIGVAIRPEGLQASFILERFGKPKQIAASDIYVLRDGFSQFRMVRRDGTGKTLVFRREWLWWKLVALN